MYPKYLRRFVLHSFGMDRRDGRSTSVVLHRAHLLSSGEFMYLIAVRDTHVNFPTTSRLFTSFMYLMAVVCIKEKHPFRSPRWA